MRLRDGFKGIDFSGFGENSSPDSGNVVSLNLAPGVAPDYYNPSSQTSYSNFDPGPFPSSVSYISPTSSFSMVPVQPATQDLTLPDMFSSGSTDMSIPVSPGKVGANVFAQILPINTPNVDKSVFNPLALNLNSAVDYFTKLVSTPDATSDPAHARGTSTYDATKGRFSYNQAQVLGPRPVSSAFSAADTFKAAVAAQIAAPSNPLTALTAFISKGATDADAFISKAVKDVTQSVAPPPVRTQLPSSASVSGRVGAPAKGAGQPGATSSVGSTIKTISDSLLAVLAPIASAKQTKAGQRAASATSRVSAQPGAGGGDMSTYLLIGGGVLAAGILVYVATKD